MRKKKMNTNGKLSSCTAEFKLKLYLPSLFKWHLNNDKGIKMENYLNGLRFSLDGRDQSYIQSSFYFIEQNSSCQTSIFYIHFVCQSSIKLWETYLSYSSHLSVIRHRWVMTGNSSQVIRISNEFFPFFLCANVFSHFLSLSLPYALHFFLCFPFYPVLNVFASSSRLSLKGIYQSIVNFTSYTSKPKQFSFHSM